MDVTKIILLMLLQPLPVQPALAFFGLKYFTFFSLAPPPEKQVLIDDPAHESNW
jgi:hypothetical protein